MANAGVTGIVAADAIVGLGMTMTQLSPATTSALQRVVPLEESLHSSIDPIASADAKRHREALRCAAKDAGIDGLVVLFVPPIMIDAAAVAPCRRFQMPAYQLMRPGNTGITLVNTGVSPSNAKTITDHLAGVSRV